MVKILQHNAKIKWRQFEITVFQYGPAGEFSPCQKKFFQSKILRSKQTTAKGKQIENQGYGLGYWSKW